MDFDAILQVVEGSHLREAAKDAVRVVVEKARLRGSLTEEEKEQIVAIFELEERETTEEIRDHEQDAEVLESYLRSLDDEVAKALRELESLEGKPDADRKESEGGKDVN